MRILVLSERYWPDGSGGILATYLINQILAQKGLKLTVVTGTNQPCRIEGIDYLIMPSFNQRNKMLLWFNLASIGRTYSFRRLLEETDVVYIPRYCYPVIPLAKRLGKRVIVHLHDYQPIAYNASILHPYSDENLPFFKSVRDSVQYELIEHQSTSRAILSALFTKSNNLARNWLKEADEVICVSKRQAEIISKKLGITVKVIYNPLPEASLIAKKADASAFLYTGGTGCLKGMRVFLEATKRILRRKNCRFMVTKGAKSIWQQELGNLASAYQILGWVEYEELHRLHSYALALLFPSIWEEPLPYAVLEAMLQGTIPIASMIGGVPEIVEGSFAEKMLFRPGDVSELVKKMETVLSLDKEQIEDIGYDLRESSLKKFDAATTRDSLLKLFS